MATSIRSSMFKHIYGKPLKKEECFDDIPIITKSAFDTSFCDVNPKFLAVLLESSGGGSFLVLPIDKVGRLLPNTPTVSGHSKPVSDVKWCPHDDNIIASASDDCTVKIWSIVEPSPEDTEGKLTFNELATLEHHQRRVNFIVWHPTVGNVLLSCGADNLVVLWDLEAGSIMAEKQFEYTVSSASFNENGSKLVLGLKEGRVMVLNARTLETLAENKCHDSAKAVQVVYLKEDRVFTTSFSKMGKRVYSLWDASDLSTPKASEDLDNNNGVLFLHYDKDCNVIFSVGKGDCVVRYFEYDPVEPAIHYLGRADWTESQSGFAFMGKRGINVSTHEITRMYKLYKRKVEVIPFYVPRKSDQFQEDLYPDTAGMTPGATVAEWLEGKEAEPVLISLKESFLALKAAGTGAIGMRRAGGGLGQIRSHASVFPGEALSPMSASMIENMQELSQKMTSVMERLAALEQQVQELKCQNGPENSDN